MEESGRHPLTATSAPRRWARVIQVGVLGAIVAWWGLTILNCAIGGILIRSEQVLLVVEVFATVVALMVGALAGFGAWVDGLERERRLVGSCVKCGYDLRGSANRCPECGKRFTRLRSLRPPAWMPKRARRRRSPK